MRLLVVGHPLIVAYNQKKYVAMKQVEPNLQLRIVGPRQSRHVFGIYRCEAHPELNDDVAPLAAVLSRSHMTYLLDPVQMASILRNFRPDLIHIEEEPQSFVALETLWLRDFLWPRAAVVLFTWDNLHRQRRFPLSWLKSRLRAYSLRRATAIVCGNREAERLLCERGDYNGLTTVLPQFGLDPSEHIPGFEAELKQQFGFAGSLVVGYLGRLVEEKGVVLLLQVLAQLTEHPWKLLLVGTGPLERQIHEQWMPRFPGRITHVQAVPHHEVPRYLRCLDVFALASYTTPTWKEQFGLTLAQAMMLGIPCVASSSGAIPDVAGPGALIFDEGSEQSLRSALESLLRSAGLRSELGARAREFALRHYTLGSVAAEYLAIFEQARRLHAAPGQQVRQRTAAAESSRAYHR